MRFRRGGFQIILILGILLGCIAPGFAELTCEDEIGPNEVVTLKKDLICPGSGDPALTVKSGTVLDLGGKVIDCVDKRRFGILIDGEGAIVKGGAVTRCSRGVEIDGIGNHIIKKIKVSESGQSGFNSFPGTDNNVITYNTARNNNFDGFFLNSGENEISFNVSEGNNNGFSSGAGVQEGTIYRYNLAKNNQRSGFVANNFEGIPDTDFTFKNNLAISNKEHGFVIEGLRHILIGNLAKGNELDGFKISGIDTKVFFNTATRNLGSGFSIGPIFQQFIEENHLYGNTALKNQGNGIIIELDAFENTVIGNFSKGNVGDDLVDDNPDCDNNVWKLNRGSRNQTCIN